MQQKLYSSLLWSASCSFKSAASVFKFLLHTNSTRCWSEENKSMLTFMMSRTLYSGLICLKVQFWKQPVLVKTSRPNMSKAHEMRDRPAVPVRRLFWSISIHFIAIRSWNLRHSHKVQKNTNTPYFWGSWSFKVIDVDTTKKLVTTACYDKQHVCSTYLQPFSLYMSQQQ